MKKLLRLSSALAAAIFVFTIAVPTVAAFTAPDSMARNLNQSIDYLTVQAAVDAANPGDTIEVGLGTYPESVTISKALTLNCARVGVDARTRSGSETIIQALSITASNVIVDGCTFNGSNPATGQVRVNSATSLSGVVFQNNIFTNYQSVAIPTDNAGNILIQRNKFTAPTASAEAMQLKANSNPGGCNGSQVLNNSFVGATNIEAADINFSCTTSASSNILVSGNTSTGNSNGASFVAFSGVASGITISNNSATTSGSSIFFFGGVTGGVSITGNTFISTLGSGLRIFSGAEMGTSDSANSGTFTVTGNALTGSVRAIAVSAAGLTGGGNVVARNNNFSSNTEYGVLNQGAGPVDARGNWWGNATGPAHSGNVGATGATVSNTVTYSPWLTALPSSGAQSWRMNTSSTIQSAIDTVAAGDTLNLPAGTFAEAITISKAMTLQGVSDNATTGTIIGTTGGGTLVTIAASNVRLKNVRIDRQGAGNGINIGGSAVSNITLEGITATGAIGSLVSPGTGLRVGTGTDISGLTVTNSHFDGNDIGWYIAKESANTTNVNNVTISNTSFSNNSMKGLYAEKLSNAVLDAITVNASGTNAGYGFNTGIDINLKWSAYSNITLRNSTISGSGLMGSASNVIVPAAIAIKARDDAPSYATPAASLTGVTLNNVVVTGGVNAVRLGEPAKNNAGPANVTIVNSSFTGMSNKALINETPVATTATNNWWGCTAGPSNGACTGFSGSITFSPWVGGQTTYIVEDDIVPVVDTPGEAVMPDNKDVFEFSNDTVLNLDQNTTATSTLVVDGNSLDTTQTIGGIEVVVEKVVTIQSGTSNPITIVNTAAPEITIELPAQVAVYAPDSWDGIITPPTLVTPAPAEAAPSGFSFGGTVLKVGSDDVTLVFDEVVTLTLEGVTGSVGYKSAGSSEWHLISTCGGTYASPVLPTFPGECAISNGSDTKILTFHFTSFAALTATATTSSSSSSNSATTTPQTRSTRRSTASTSTGDAQVAAEQAAASSAQTETPAEAANKLATAVVPSSRMEWWTWLLVGVTIAGVIYYLAEDKIHGRFSK